MNKTTRGDIECKVRWLNIATESPLTRWSDKKTGAHIDAKENIGHHYVESYRPGKYRLYRLCRVASPCSDGSSHFQCITGYERAANIMLAMDGYCSGYSLALKQVNERKNACA